MSTTVGILGGGQLGRMLFQQGANYPVQLKFLDKDPEGPCGSICKNVTQGNPLDFDDVLAFGRTCDVVSIEIEAVNQRLYISYRMKDKNYSKSRPLKPFGTKV